MSAAEVSSQTADTMLDDFTQLDDESLLDTAEMTATVAVESLVSSGVAVGSCGVGGHDDVTVEEMDTMSQRLVGVHEAILMSIDQCGQSSDNCYHCCCCCYYYYY